MNTVLQFALDNQTRTKNVLAGVYGVAQDDLADLGQDVLLRILRANPQNVDYPQQYWTMTVRSAVFQWWRERGKRATVHLDESIEGDWLADPAQDPVQTQETREEIAAALSQANERERAALLRSLLDKAPISPCDRVRIHRFRQRLQGAMA